MIKTQKDPELSEVMLKKQRVQLSAEELKVLSERIWAILGEKREFTSEDITLSIVMGRLLRAYSRAVA